MVCKRNAAGIAIVTVYCSKCFLPRIGLFYFFSICCALNITNQEKNIPLVLDVIYRKKNLSKSGLMATKNNKIFQAAILRS